MALYPKVKDETLVGTYAALSHSGGGYVWDEVLEYRVWCHPHGGAPNLEDGDDYYYSFNNCEDAFSFSENNPGTEEPIALIEQTEYISEPEPGNYIHVKEVRVTEWPIKFLNRPRRNENTILDFFSPNAPSNRLDILRGLA